MADKLTNQDAEIGDEVPINQDEFDVVKMERELREVRETIQRYLAAVDKLKIHADYLERIIEKQDKLREAG